MSILETVQHARLEDLWRLGKHCLTVGAPRCLSLDTQILWKDSIDESFRIVTLKNIIGREGFVQSFDFKRKLVIVNKALVKPSGRKKLYQIKLKNGKTVKASLDHKFFVEEKGLIKEKKLSELKIGDKIIVEGF